MRGAFDTHLKSDEPKTEQGGWRVFPDTGIAVNALGHWNARSISRRSAPAQWRLMATPMRINYRSG
ncbi:MAG: hypothetical protein CM1200mP29_16560 [Verrucomicrobiota bacterium]|nr:MAG: hypothetical protein CM1200mP29_16560 [Verrucomicrobiota bacterium]